jgi:hypothetical protein
MSRNGIFATYRGRKSTMKPEEITTQLLSNIPGVSEVYHVTEFQVYREAKDGHIQTVSVKILDAGPDTEHGLRYHCYATTDDGKSATGNPDKTIEVTLALVHWGDLDR